MISFKTKDVKIYLASAGCAKTTALKDEVVEALKIYRPDEIAYVTFTRKGVANGIERILESNPHLREEDLVHCQTLHSMCFSETGLKHVNIMEQADIERFNDLLGFDVHFAQSFENSTEDDKLLQRYDAARAGSRKGIFVERAYDEERYDRLISAYEAFKKENDLVDFYDCLTQFMKRGLPVSVKFAGIDEAQDLTPLQWDVCELAFSTCETVRVAGDDFQSLFSYAGASPEILIDLSRRYEVVKLESSYRLPRAVYNFSRGITSMIQEKVDKDSVPIKDEEGFVKLISDRTVLCRIIREDLEKNGYLPNRWYLLFRNNCFIDDITTLLDQYTVPYATSRGFCVSARDLAKVRRYYNFRKEGFSNDVQLKQFMDFNRIENLEADFTESDLIPGENRYLVKEFVDKYGIDGISNMAISPPAVYVSTPHRVKGGEADFSVVFLDCTRLVSENALINLDEELRVLYVACTRARHGLYLVPSIGRYGLDNIIELVREAVE